MNRKKIHWKASLLVAGCAFILILPGCKKNEPEQVILVEYGQTDVTEAPKKEDLSKDERPGLTGSGAIDVKEKEDDVNTQIGHEPIDDGQGDKDDADKHESNDDRAAAQTTPEAPEKPKPSENTPTKPKPTETEPPKPAHTHSYTSSKIEPTCTAGGYTKHTCSCGASYMDGERAALGHDYKSNLTSSVRSGAKFVETYTYTCSRCGDSYTDTKTVDSKKFNCSNIMSTYNGYAASTYGFTIDGTLNSSNASCVLSYSGYLDNEGQLSSQACSIVDGTASQIASMVGCSAYDMGGVGARGNFIASYNAGADTYTLCFYYK